MENPTRAMSFRKQPRRSSRSSPAARTCSRRSRTSSSTRRRSGRRRPSRRTRTRTSGSSPTRWPGSSSTSRSGGRLRPVPHGRVEAEAPASASELPDSGRCWMGGSGSFFPATAWQSCTTARSRPRSREQGLRRLRSDRGPGWTACLEAARDVDRQGHGVRQLAAGVRWLMRTRREPSVSSCRTCIEIFET